MSGRHFSGGILALFLVLVSFVAPTAFSKSRIPIRHFLEGYTEKDGKTFQGHVEGGTFHKGMGLENPGLVELLSLSYGALTTVEKRSVASSERVNKLLTEVKLTSEEVKRLRALVAKDQLITAAERAARQKPKRLTDAETKELAALLKKAEAKSGDAKLLPHYLHYERRARAQYYLALELLRELMVRSLDQFDLRGYLRTSSGKDVIYHKETSEEQERRKDIQMKSYVVDRAGELYLGALKFLSLKQNPFPGEKLGEDAVASNQTLETGDLENEEVFEWLDWDSLQLGSAKAVETFLSAPVDKIPFYANQNLIPAANIVAEGFKKLLNSSEEGSALMALNLSEPSPDQKEALAKQVLGAAILKTIPNNQLKKTYGLITFYLHCIGAVVDSFNVNTHDSVEVMRSSMWVLFRHVIDIDAHEGWKKDSSALRLAVKYAPFPTALPQYLPVEKSISAIQSIRQAQFLEDTKSGPKLELNDELERKKEFRVYRGDLLKELFGADYSNYVWPFNEAFAGDPKIDVRTQFEIPQQLWKKDKQGRLIPEVRQLNGEPLPEAKQVQDGDVWADLGTGLGSQFIALATAPATPDTRVKAFVHKTSVWDVAKEKLYGYWSAALGWASNKVTEWTGVEVEALKTKQPGAGVDFKGLSHVGVVEVFGDPSYPELTRADLIDAFPNRMRQAWRGHAWGNTHARKGALFRLRPHLAENHAKNFDKNLAALTAQLSGELYRNLPRDKQGAWADARQNPAAAFGFCRTYTTQLKFADFDDVDRFTRERAQVRPILDYCEASFRYHGMMNFKRTVLDKGGAAWPGEKIVTEMGKEVVQVGRSIRNQWGEYKGFGVRFDDHFDSFTKGSLYCSEFVHDTWMLAAGMNVWPPAKFVRPMKELLKILPESTVADVSGGFFKVPYTEEDTVYAPQDIIQSDFGHDTWRAVIVTYFTFFGVNDE